MDNFTFQNPTKIIFGKDRLADIKMEIPLDANILLVYGKNSIKETGLYNQIRDVLKDYNIIDFGGVGANPTFEHLMLSFDLIKKHSINYILAVGGGSVIDGSKFISVAAFLNDPWHTMQKAVSYEKIIPLGVVLTLPATGSEMNGGFVVTYEKLKDKRAFVNVPIYPKFSYLDPTQIYTLPLKQISNGVVDAFVHVMEQYVTYPVNAYLQDGYAETILKTLIEIGPKLIKNPKDYDLAANFMWCTTMALNGLIGSGVPQDWATHMIGHELTALYNVDHACSLALVLPSLLNSQRNMKADKIIQYGVNVWGLDKNDSQIIDKAINKTEDFFRRMGIKTKLSEYDIFNADQIIPEKMTKNMMLPLGEHSLINESSVREILIAAK